MKIDIIRFISLVSVTLDVIAHQQQWIKPDMKHMRNHYYSKGENTHMLPAEKIMTAISNMETTFNVHFKTANLNIEDDMQSYSFDNLAEISVYEAFTNFVFRKEIGFISLDEMKNIVDIDNIDDHGITHCPSEGHDHASIGDMFIASRHGHYIRSNNGINPMLHDYIISLELDSSSVDFHLIRRVVRRQFLPKSYCARYVTEDAHPLELFDYFNMSVNVSKPYNTEYINIAGENDEKMKRDVTLPSKGIYACDDSWWSSWLSTTLGYGSNYGIYGSSYACFQVDQTIAGSISMNYDFSSKTATKKSLSIGSGVTCLNCYAFLGGQYQVNIQYSFTYGFAFDARIFGGEGFQVDLTLQNPSISGSLSLALLGESASYITLFSLYGIYVSTKFSGLDVTLTGSGSATGYLKIGAGQSITAGIYLNYGYSDKWTYGALYDTTYQPPTMYYTNFKLDKLSLTATLTAKISLKMSYGSSNLLSGYYDIHVSPYTTYLYGFSSSSLVVVVDSDQSDSRIPYGLSHEFSAENEMKTYSPGDIVIFRVEYTDFVPKEKLDVFFSLHNGSISIPVMNSTHITSANGTGNFTAPWLVPWDIRIITESGSPDLGTKIWQVQVRCSNQINKKIFSGQFFQVIDSSAFLSVPINGKTVDINSSFKLSWDPDLLYYFETTNVFIGTGITCVSKKVTLYLYPESCTVAEDCTRRIVLVKNVDNNGQLNVTIATNLTTIEERMYIVIVAMENSNVRGWSYGFFRLSIQPNTNLTLPTNNDEIVRNASVLIRKVGRLPSPDPQARTSSCSSSQAFTTLGAYYASGLTSMYIAYFPISAPGVSPTTYPLISPSDACASVPTVEPTPLPTTVPTKMPLLPTPFPSSKPTVRPLLPTPFPSNNPTVRPILPTPFPSNNPTVRPLLPTPFPSNNPTVRPLLPTPFPSNNPTVRPLLPTPFPSNNPTVRPLLPTPFPSNNPTVRPLLPTPFPSNNPTVRPLLPTPFPSNNPTVRPLLPTPFPSNNPTVRPLLPTPFPSNKPTVRPLLPTPFPSDEPTKMPLLPTPFPSDEPTKMPLLPTPFLSDEPTKMPLLPTPFLSDEPTKMPLLPTPFPSDEPTKKPLLPTPFPGNKPTERPLLPTPFLKVETSPSVQPSSAITTQTSTSSEGITNLVIIIAVVASVFNVAILIVTIYWCSRPRRVLPVYRPNA